MASAGLAAGSGSAFDPAPAVVARPDTGVSAGANSTGYGGGGYGQSPYGGDATTVATASAGTPATATGTGAALAAGGSSGVHIGVAAAAGTAPFQPGTIISFELIAFRPVEGYGAAAVPTTWVAVRAIAAAGAGLAATADAGGPAAFKVFAGRVVDNTTRLRAGTPA